MKYTPATPTSTTGKLAARARSGKVVARKSVPPGEIRIIGGQYKRTRLPVPDKPGLRPTPDRVRETVFNWLGQDLTGWRCMDVFAGTGALGFEAASRGAAEVLLCEQDATLVARLHALQLKLQADMVRVERGDGIALLRRQSPGSLQLVFLDPPFDSPLFEGALKAAAQAVSDPGYVYLEAPKPWDDEALSAYGLKVHRSGKAGAVHFHLLVRNSASA
ncbi:16S rRNA (guanine(966)-N(2))-methyltransferase RsmD [Polaromonas sp.]|uniref:16S rRNA (guanine(966)-N(2))-methyltransferase RsmD n=1 Tax=Polaromonas sp. TaxID=1869339 RepID=UPI003561FCD8